MAKIVTFTCSLPNGIHARPASHIESLCNGFSSHFHWHNPRTGITGDGKSVLSLIGADILLGDECQVTIEGEDCHGTQNCIEYDKITYILMLNIEKLINNKHLIFMNSCPHRE